MKACFKCKQFKPHDAFYAQESMRDGLSGKCKECTKAGVRENYRAHLDKYKEYERGRAMAPHRVEARQRYQQTPNGKDAVYRGQRKYATSEHGKQAMAVAHRQYRINNPLKRAAHILVGNAPRLDRRDSEGRVR